MPGPSIIRRPRIISARIPAPVAVVPAVLLLDGLGLTAARAYSMRKLRAAYAGSAIRVRRSSDNAELDIGFIGESLDNSALLAHCGAGDGFITTEYDQSGSGDNAVQATAGLQPRIVSGGVLDVLNSRPAPRFNGDPTESLSTDLAASSSFTAVEALVMAATAAGGPTFGQFIPLLGVSGSASIFVGIAGTNDFGSDGPYTTWTVNNGANDVPFGSTLFQANGYGAGGAATLHIGRGSGLPGWAGGTPGWICEAVVFSSALTAGNRTTAYTNQKTYWGTP